MGISTRIFGDIARQAAPTTAVSDARTVGEAVRSRVAVFPATPLSEILDILRTGTARTVAVVSPFGQLIGVVHESDVARLLSESFAGERSTLLKTAVSQIMSPPSDALLYSLSTQDALLRLQESCRDALPVVEESGRFIGMVSAGDFIREMVRPLRPPMLGGLATPFGVYLTSGNRTGGVGVAALLATGMLFCGLHLLTYYLTLPLHIPISRLPISLRGSATDLLDMLTQVGLLFLVVRLSPMAGYHAAEHQAVHAVERGEPLTIDSVRAMPRVHPRCGTNFVAGGLIISLMGVALQPLIGTLGYLIGAVTALALWRDAGAWLQQHLTTRPASDRELRSGIQAAMQILEHSERDAFLPAPPWRRVWNMGFLPLIFGFLIGCGLVALLSIWFPSLKEPLRSYLLAW